MDILVPEMIQSGNDLENLWWNRYFEALEADEVTEADEVNEAAKVIRPE